MGLRKITGEVTGFSQQTVITSTQTNRTGLTAVNSHNEASFRIGNKPVVLKLSDTVHLNDGGNATAVGRERKGVVQAIAIRNDDTGVTYTQRVWKNVIFGLILILVGFLGITEWWGIAGILLGGALLYDPYTVFFKAINPA